MPFSGQLWYLTEGGDAETRLVRINDDGATSTIVNDNGGGGTGDDDFISSFTADIGVDTAAGFYFAITNAPAPQNDTAYLVRGVIGGGSAPVIVVDFADGLIVNTLEVDAINHRIYVGVQDGLGTNGGITGIKVYTYDPSTGAVTDTGFLTTANTDNRADAGGSKILDPFDFAIDYSINRMFYTEHVDGLTSGLFRIDLSSPNTATNMLTVAQFPVDLSAGQIMDVAVDTTTDLVYFTTRSRSPSPNGAYDANDNALWYVSENATGATATKVTLTGLPANVYYGGDMAFDQSTRQIYLESSEASPGAADNVIYVFQLNGAGASASLIRTINPGLTLNGAVTEGMTFVDVAALDVAGTGASPTEQAAGTTTLLTGAPTITDTDGGYLIGATVQITSGAFNTTDDHIGFSASKIVSGTVPGTTNITINWNAATSTLTLSGYDTFANYQTALAGLVYWSTGDNPTNYGANTSRTLTWTINDGTPGILTASPNGATVNIDTTTITIAATNDAPVNGTVSSATGNENTTFAITGLQVSDVDANPASALVTVTLSVTKGVLTLLTNVSSGLVSGDIVGNGTASVTITATINKINLTLAASNGLVFLGNTNVSGTDTLTVVTSDGGATGSGGAQSDTNGYTITIIGVNDAPVVSGDGTEALTATNEDVANAALTNTVSTLFSGQYTDPDTDAFAGVAVIVNGSSAGTGQWQYYNGSTWVNIGAASTAAAVTLAAATPLRFLPATDFNGPAPTLTVRVVDASGGALTSGAVVNTTTNGGSMAYSTGTVVLSHGVTAVNDAPTVTGGSSVSLASIGEDSAPGAGETVSSLFASHFSDAKDQVPGGSSANTLAGVAVTANAATAAQGVYQYFDGTWQDLPAVSTASAFVLDASTLVRFVPAADYSGTAPALTVSLIDNSSGAVTTGATSDLSTTGGSTPYSAALTLNVTVTATNDAPVASGSATLAAVNEDTAAPSGASVSTLFAANFSDPDGNGLAGVAITGNAASTQGVWQYFNGAWTTIGSPSEGAALVLAAGTLVRFLPAANFEGSVPALTAYLIDNSGGAVTTGSFLDVSVNGGQTRFSDVSVSLSTSITAVNDAPVVPSSATTVGATEQTAAVLLGSLTVSDLELDARNGGIGDYAGASFTVQRASANAADTFFFGGGSGFTISGANLQIGGLTFATFTSTGGVLTVTFTSSGDSATTALVNDVIHNIRYTNTSDAPPASVTLNYSLNDGGGQGTGGALANGGSVQVNLTAVNDVHTGGASVTGTAAEDQVLTAVSTLADADGLGTLHYQWQHDVGGGFVNVGTDQSTYTLGDGDIGGVVRVVIYYTDAGGTVESATSAATAAITASNDAPTGGVSVTGTATEDQVLTADTSTLADSDGLGTLHYDWQHNVGSGFVSIGAADQATYSPDDADVGGLIRVVVSYTDGQGFANTVTSAASAAIAGVNDSHTGGAGITGTATEDQVLTAVSTLADVDGLGTLHYQWQHDVGGGFVNVGTDQATYTLSDADVGGLVRVVISYTDGQGFAESATSASTAAISNVNDAPTGVPGITGTKTENQVLTADMGPVVDADGLGTLHYQWQRNTGSGFVNIGTDQATYTLGDADVGGVVRVVVNYTDDQGTAEAVTSAATAAIAGVNDPHTGGASVTGTATEDQVLTAVSTLADVDGLGTLHYQWQHDIGGGFVNVGTDQATYTLSDADVGGVVRVVISYTDGQGFAESATSASTAAIANINDPHTGGASVTGTTMEGQVLTANTSTLVDVDGLGTLHYQWQRNTGSGFVNVGNDQATYTLGDADVGGVVRVVVNYTDDQGTAEAVTSAATAAISAANDPHTGGASVTGTATEDQVLTAVSTLADADGLGTLHYQWQHNVGGGFVNVGTDQATYTLSDADVGGVVRVVISYTDGQGFAESATSAATAAIANINDPHTGGVSVTGATNVGHVLTADTSTLADADGLGTLHYQWQSDTGSGFVNIGTDQSTYTLTGAELGGVIRVVTTYTDDQGTAEAATSAATSTVLPANGPHTGTVTITGTVTEDQVLTADTSTLADPAGLGAFSYQWQRNTGSGFTNVGTNLATYTLGDADVGATIRVIVSFTDGQGVVETETSGATVAVANVNDPPTGAVTITGTVAENQVLTADTSTLADADGLGALHYQWQRDTGGGFVNVGTDLSTYTLGDADVGATIRVVTTYTDQHGAAESKTSAATAAVANVNDGPTAANDATAVIQRLTSAMDSVRTNDGDIDNALTTLTVTNVAYNATQVDQAVMAGGTVVNGAYGKLTINPDGSYTYTADGEGLVVGQVVTDTFDYTIKDPSGAAATAQLTVTVTGSATGDANANILISNASGHTLTGKGGADTLTGAGGADVFAYEAVSDSTIAAFDTITDFAHAEDTLRLTPLITGSTKLTLNTDGTGKTLLIDQNGDGAAEGQIRLLGQGLEVSDIVTGVANLGFTLNGSAAGEFLTGGSGADTINGSGGADTIRGNGGGDILTGGEGLDTFVYDDGDASILHWDVITDFQTGQDKLNIAAADDGIVILARFGASTFIYFGGLGNSSVVQVFGNIRTSDLIVSNGVTFSMYGDDGNSGGLTSDTLTGGDQDDVLVGGTTDSTLTGGDGADIMYGGAARDTFRYESVSNSNFSAYDSVIGFTPDQDKIDISAIDGGKVTIARFAGTTFIYSAPDAGGNFQSVITVSGTSVKATDVIASGGPTQSFVMVGDSTSSNVADTLIAGAGNDILYGLDGNDALIGAGGADFMLGGAGADAFVYTAATDSSPFAQDLIFDFSSAEADKLDLTGIDANSGTGANDAFSVVASFSNVAGQLVIVAPDASGYYHVSGDVNGDGVADLVIALKVTGTLAASDILL